MSATDTRPLSERTTLGVGGPARYALDATSADEVRDALAWASAHELPLVVLGGGSNVLVADRGFDGVVLRVTARGITTEEDGTRARVTVGAGTPWDELVAFTVARGYAGLECLSGIPGDVGAAPMQNIGAYGQEVADTIAEVRLIDRTNGAEVCLPKSACGFGYRESVFKGALADRYVVVSVTFEFTMGPPTLAYAELTRALEHVSDPSLALVRETVLSLRRTKSMVLDPSDPNGRSAGSFFVNPTLTHTEADEVLVRAKRRGVAGSMPRFPHGERVKLSAGWLIEHAGLEKGTVRGAVGLSTKHCLAIINRGGATAADVVAFATEVKSRVADAFGVALSPEPRPIGFVRGELDALYG